MDVSIVIPTKNGGHLFEKVLDAVFKQKTEYEYEVICRGFRVKGRNARCDPQISMPFVSD